jgi:hypothetical protein
MSYQIVPFGDSKASQFLCMPYQIVSFGDSKARHNVQIVCIMTLPPNDIRIGVVLLYQIVSFGDSKAWCNGIFVCRIESDYTVHVKTVKKL